jgi:hypothetical protein
MAQDLGRDAGSVQSHDATPSLYRCFLPRASSAGQALATKSPRSRKEQAMVGLWCGVNIGKGQPVYSNPLKTKSIANKILESSGDALEKSGRALKEKIQK